MNPFRAQPAGLPTLFFTEVWERFSYYGMRGLLILYMTTPLADGGLGYDTARAGAVYGLYAGCVYLACLPGGWLADRVLGARRATLAGGCLILAGHLCLAAPLEQGFYAGLVLVVLGTGLLKPAVSTLVGRLYAPGDARRDAGYSLYYLGINLGAFLAPLVCGTLALGTQFRSWLGSHGWSEHSAWHWGFAAAAVGMALGLVQFRRGAARFAGEDLPGSPDDATLRQCRRGLLMLLGTVAALALLLGQGVMSLQTLSNALGAVLVAVTVIFFAVVLRNPDWSAEERERLWLIVVLFLAAAVFWSLFEQGGSTLNLFAARNTRLEVAGLAFPAAWFQAVNPLFIIALAPVFAWGWVRLGARNPPSLVKFVLGLVLVAAGFAVLVIPAQSALQGVKVSPWWLVLTYLLHTLGELCLSPVGLSAISRLAPARIASLMMGLWFLASALGNYLGGRVAGLYETFSLPALFTTVAAVALASAVLLVTRAGRARALEGAPVTQPFTGVSP